MYSPFFHVGVLVRDIDEAVRDFSEVLGIEFEDILTAPVATGETIRCCYSYGGPPMLELVEATGTGIWRPDLGEGLHHLGFATPDVAAVCPAFSGEVDTIIPGADAGDGPRVIYTRPQVLHGVRVEYLKSSMVEASMARLAAHRSV
ncbi:MAG: VOC family protein [Nocardioides sp.]|uniref:VOC family protein n=1 Tax=Nocardioides sp. TaxID=35761 RepID=UPI0039E5FE02